MNQHTKRCHICKRTNSNKFEYGEWITAQNLTFHHFCALLATNLQQVNTDFDGEQILHFSVDEIREFPRKHTKTKCYCCHKKGAYIRCSARKANGSSCGRYFHLECGIQKGCLSKFIGTFRSVCHEHDYYREQGAIHSPTWSCQICLDDMGPYNKITSIKSCCSQGFVHKKCMQEHAYSSGYNVKCFCNRDSTKKKYRRYLKLRGIYIPDHDAVWEKSDELNRYGDQEKLFTKCFADNCLCPLGTGHNDKKGTPWVVRLCRGCGGDGIHIGCQTEEQKNAKTIHCIECKRTYAEHNWELETDETQEEEEEEDDDDENEEQTETESEKNTETDVEEEDDEGEDWMDFYDSDYEEPPDNTIRFEPPKKLIPLSKLKQLRKRSHEDESTVVTKKLITGQDHSSQQVVDIPIVKKSVKQLEKEKIIARRNKKIKETDAKYKSIRDECANMTWYYRDTTILETVFKLKTFQLMDPDNIDEGDPLRAELRHEMRDFRLKTLLNDEYMTFWNNPKNRPDRMMTFGTW